MTACGQTAFLSLTPLLFRGQHRCLPRVVQTRRRSQSSPRACASANNLKSSDLHSDEPAAAATRQPRGGRPAAVAKPRGNNLVLVGLGNPGPRYAHTRHNVGFEIADMLAVRNRATFSVNKKLQADVAVADLGERKMHIIKPRTFMNLSGASVRAALKWCNASVTALLVVADDMSLEVGRVRMRAKGSAGGHNGLKSVEGVLKSKEYARLKVGVGSPGAGAEEWKTHVLGKFSRSEASRLEEVYMDCAEVVEFWAKEPDIEKVISRMGMLVGGGGKR